MIEGEFTAATQARFAIEAGTKPHSGTAEGKQKLLGDDKSLVLFV